MKKSLLLFMLGLMLIGCQEEQAEVESSETETTEQAVVADPQAMTDDEKMAYAIGANIGHQVLKQQERLQKIDMTLDTDLIAKGLLDTMDDKAVLEREEQLKLVSTFQRNYHKKQQEYRKKEAEENGKQGEAFLAEHAKKEGVKVTESGLQYIVLQEGEGEHPKATDRVKVHYKGMLIDGTEFDSSHSRNTPATFSLAGVIQGWTEGIQLMQPGAKYHFVIPAELAYGARGKPPSIPANAVLQFEVELLAIEPPNTKAKAKLHTAPKSKQVDKTDL